MSLLLTQTELKLVKPSLIVKKRRKKKKIHSGLKFVCAPLQLVFINTAAESTVTGR